MLVRRPAQRAALALTWCALVACSGHGPPRGEGLAPQPGGSAPLRLGLVADRSPAEASLSVGCETGMRRAQGVLGASTQVLWADSRAERLADLNVLATEGVDEIVAVGGPAARDLAVVARDFPKAHFAIVGARVAEPNVASLVFRSQEGAFLAGTLAGLLTRTQRVGFLGGAGTPEDRSLAVSFEAGVRQGNPRARTSAAYAGSSNDPAAGNRAARELARRGTDVLFVNAGRSSLGAYAALGTHPRLRAIATGNPARAAAAGIIANVDERADIAVFTLALAAQAQKPPSGPLVFGLADGGIAVELAPAARSALGARRNDLERVRAGLVAGTIVPPTSRAALARDAAPSLR